jgi:hypothetical protein
MHGHAEIMVRVAILPRFLQGLMLSFCLFGRQLFLLGQQTRVFEVLLAGFLREDQGYGAVVSVANVFEIEEYFFMAADDYHDAVVSVAVTFALVDTFNVFQR